MRIEALELKLGAALVDLASHAALPVVINPELLHLLRINFLLDLAEPPTFEDEGRLLLSTVCHELGDGLYEVESANRGPLLARLESRHGPQRLRDVAALLWQYCERGAWSSRPELERAQQLTALNFLDPTQARGWLDRLSTDPAGPAAGREWLVAMQARLATLNERPSSLATPTIASTA